MKRLLFYSHDTYGLGNVRRMLSVANHLVEQHKDISVLLISGSPMLHAFRIPRQIDYIKLPCLDRSRAGKYSARLESFSAKELLKLRSKLIRNVVLEFKPDLLLIDKKPEGLGGELRRTFKALREQENPPKKLLLLSDILDSPKITREIWERHKYYKTLKKNYDEILVVGQQSLFDVPKEYSFPPALVRKTTFCGYLKRPAGKFSRNRMRSTLGLTGQHMVLVAAGGGDDGKQVLSNYLEGIRENPLPDGGRSILFHGPEMRHPDFMELIQLANQCTNVEIREFSNDFMSYLDAADTVVAMGGYNTLCELLSLNKQAIIVPRVTPVAEQQIRAKRFNQLGLLDYIHPDDLTPSRLMTLLKKHLRQGNSSRSHLPIDMEGMSNLERRLLSNIAARNSTMERTSETSYLERRHPESVKPVTQRN